MNKTETFKTELSLFHEEGVRLVAKRIIEDIPDYFFAIPASSTGKYHPAFALGEGGLVRHTQVAVRIADELLKLDMYKRLHPMHDLILFALLFHDCKKNGDGEKYTRADHPILASNFIKEHLGDTDFRVAVCCMIESHMGQWNTDFKTNKEILPLPVTAEEKFVHQCDYLASRKSFFEL